MGGIWLPRKCMNFRAWNSVQGPAAAAVDEAGDGGDFIFLVGAGD